MYHVLNMNKIYLLRNVVMVTLLTDVSADIWKYINEDPEKVIIIYDSNSNSLRSYDEKNIFARRAKSLKEEKLERKKEELVKSQHKRKMKEINEFMKDHLMSTNYFYDEMKRIKEKHQVKGALRKMVEWLEAPKRDKEKRKVYKCYVDIRREHAKKNVNLWAHDTNNLVINVLKDPYNDGYIN